MLEGILYEGNKDERSYFSTAVRSDVYLCFHTDVGGETDAHQFDVVADEVHLLVQGDEVLLIVIQHMAQQSAQFLHGSLCLVGIEGDEGVDVIQRIEQEVRVELVAQVLQLGFRAAFLGFAAGASICAQRRLSLMAALRPAVRIMVETSRKMNIHLGGPMC